MDTSSDFDPDRVIEFYLPASEGARTTFNRLAADVKASGPGWQLRIYSPGWSPTPYKPFTPLGNLAGYYIRDGKSYQNSYGEIREIVTLMSHRWLDLGDGKALVQLQCESEDLWRSGAFHKLLDDIVYVWGKDYPDIIADIDRALGIDEETGEGEVEERQESISTREEPWERIPDHLWDRKAVRKLWEGHTAPEIAGMVSASTSRVYNRLDELRAEYPEVDIPKFRDARRRLKKR